MNINQFEDLIVQPTLEELGCATPNAIQLVTATALAESRLFYIHQLGGPALGVFQMEPATHDDVWNNYLRYRPEIADKIDAMGTGLRCPHELIWNLKYAAAMCRIHYLRVPKPLPQYNNAHSMAQYWKEHYNTHLGKGTIEHFLSTTKILFGGNQNDR